MLKKLRLAQIERQKLWDSGSMLDLSYFGNAAAGEMGEACNIIKKLERERFGLPGSRSTVELLADELADVVIYLDLIAAKTGINLEAAIKNKFNKDSTEHGFDVLIDDKPYPYPTVREVINNEA
jgi:NTP pyrophosphatase (non-canonical NTP hydrolase)